MHRCRGLPPTGLTGYLRERGITRLFLAGLALDFCVRYSAEDAIREGFVREGFVVVVWAALKATCITAEELSAFLDMVN